MGVSTDAQLCFGIPLVDPDEADRPMPWEDGEFENDYDQWIDEKCKNIGLSIVSHCSNDYPMFILAINRTLQIASRGDTKLVEPMTQITAEELETLAKCVQDNLLETAGPAGWYLTSYWG